MDAEEANRLFDLCYYILPDVANRFYYHSERYDCKLGKNGKPLGNSSRDHLRTQQATSYLRNVT
jgi:hypothetical protein